LEALATRRQDVFVRIVDIVSWDSPVARQHGVQRLPSVWLYEDGELVTADTGRAVGVLNGLR
jgi:hypothetical protein